MPETFSNKIRPAKGKRRWTMLTKMFWPYKRPVKSRPLALRQPPQNEIGRAGWEKPFITLVHEAPMYGVPDIEFQILHAFPDRQVINLARVAVSLESDSIAALVLLTPDKPRRSLGNGVHRIKGVHESCHGRVV